LNGLIEPSDLESLLGLDDVVLVDARDQSAYNRDHIPGSISMEDIFYYISLPENGGLKGMQDFFSEQFGVAGIRPTDRVFIYEDAMDNGYGKSCRGWLILNYLGHANVRVLGKGRSARYCSKARTTSDGVYPARNCWAHHRFG
jgi:thiosulfate/3-mercaptopyruvate sulfurtransferase